MSDENGFRLAPLVAALPETVPFIGPDTLERQRGAPFRARLGANENGFGPSPAALDAYHAAASRIWCYGDAENHDLRQALAHKHGVDFDQITVGEGVDGLLGVLVRMVVQPGDWVVMAKGSYPTFAYHAQGYGAHVQTVPYRDDCPDPRALAAAAHLRGARMVYLANPDNPMAGWHPGAVIEKLIADLPTNCLLVLDEAYAEFAPPEASVMLNAECPILVRLRSFSKAYGLAGLRIGYAIGPRNLISAFDRVRNHFGVNRAAQAAALAALQDETHLAATLDLVAAARQRIVDIAHAHGLTTRFSATNFVPIDLGHDGRLTRAVVEALAEAGVFVRMPGVAPLDRHLRVSVGPEAELEIFAEALGPALEQAHKKIGPA